MPFLTSLLYSQFFVTPRLPDSDFSDQTIIITGSNTGIGLEAAKHFLHLHCARLIIAVRNTSKGEIAKKILLDTIPNIPPSSIQVWPLDLASSKSVRAFANRASNELERVDVLVENAGIDAKTFTVSEDGWESTLQTNVISTCLLAMLMLPKMRETGQKFKTIPHVVVVTSETHYMAGFAERDAQDGILKALNNRDKFNGSDRYATTKLLLILFVRELVNRLKSLAGANPSPFSPILTLPTPGLCRTPFFRDVVLPTSPLLHPVETASYLAEKTVLTVMGRTAEVGARALVTGACAGREANGEFIMDGQVRAVAAWVDTDEGRRVQKRVYEEICGAIGLQDSDLV